MALDDPIDFKIDLTTHDLVVPVVFVTGLDAVVQGIVIRLKMIGGEWFPNTEFGLKYLARRGSDTSVFGPGSPGVSDDEALLGGKFDPVTRREAFVDLILSCPHVNRVLELSLDFESATRTLLIEFRVDTTFGPSDMVGVSLAA